MNSKDPMSMSEKTDPGPLGLMAKWMICVLLGCVALFMGSRAQAVEQQIASGYNFTVTLAPDGTVWAWGDNFYGQLGNGNNSDSSVPVQVSNLTNIVAISAGFYHAMALRADGTVWAWGYNAYGQLGQGGTDSTNRNLPVQVGGLSSVSSVVCGGYTSYAITRPSSTLYGWGYNASGQVGNNAAGTNAFSPVSILGSVRKAIGGGLHALAIRLDGTLYGWGDNSYGQVGNNSFSNQPSPVAVTGVTDKYIDVAAGCWHSIALRTNGSVYTWGSDAKGQLGNGATGSVSQPTANGNAAWRVSAGYEHSLIYWFYGQTYYAGDVSYGQSLSGGSTVNNTFNYIGSHYTRPQAVVSGQGQHVALVKANGTILTWGFNSDGQLGNGTTSFGITNTEQSINPRWTLDRFIQVVAGDQHSAALRADGTVWTWGADYDGQLGNDASAVSSPVPVQITSLSDVIELAAGANHTLSLNASGFVSGWGYDYYGQLGDNDSSDSSKFVPVGLASAPFGIRTIGAGGYHSYVVTYSGCSVYGFGYNGNGALALGNYTSPIRTPTLTGLSDVLEIDGGALNTVALLVNGQMRTSGYGYYGQLGINSSSTFNTVQVPWTSSGSSSPMDSIVSVNAGGYHVTANRSSGATRSWGYNYSGQVGNNVALPGAAVLAPLGSGTAGKMASAGPFGNFSLVLFANGTVNAVGEDVNGQLGNDGSLVSSSNWVGVSGLSNICAIAAGTYHGLALQADGTLFAWGYNSNGVLGTGGSGDTQPTPITVTSDTWKPQISVSAVDGSGSEAGTNSLTYRFSRTSAYTNGGAVSVNFSLSGSAVNGTDYATVSGTTTILSGQSFVDVVVTPTDDPDDEDTETVDVNLSSGGHYRIGSPSGASGTITDNDTSGFVISAISANTQEADQASTTARSFTVRLATRPSGTVVLDLGSSNTAEGRVDTNPAAGNQNGSQLTFTALNWNTNQTVQVFGQNDDFDDGDIGYSIVIQVNTASTLDSRYDPLDPPDVAITNIDNDTAGIVVSAISGAVTEAGGTATFTITLTSRPYNPVNFTLTSSDTGEGVLVAGSSAVTIDPVNWATGSTITVQGVDDNVDDGDQAFKIDVNKSTSSDPAYNNLGGWDVAVTCTDDDTKGVVLSSTSITATEGGATGSFTVRLNSEPTSQVTLTINSPVSTQVTVDTDEGTVGNQSALVFTTANWNTTQTVRVTAVDDATIESSPHIGTIQSAVNVGSGDYTGVAISNVTVNITDNDAAGFTVLPATSLANRQITTESGGTASFTVRLNTQPTGAQTVALRMNTTDLSEGRLPGQPAILTTTGADGTNDRFTFDDNIDLAGLGLVIGQSMTVLDATTHGGQTTTITAIQTVSPKYVQVALNLSTAVSERVAFLPVDAFQYVVSTNTSTASPTNRFNLPDSVDVDAIPVGTTVLVTSATTNAGVRGLVTAKSNTGGSKNLVINPTGADTVQNTGAEILLLAPPTTRTFANGTWNVDQAVTVTGQDDLGTDPTSPNLSNYSIDFVVDTTSATRDTNYDVVVQPNQFLRNQDDDVAGIRIVQDGGSTVVDEANIAATDTYRVRLNTPPAAGKVVVISVTPDSQITTNKSLLVFTTSNYSTEQVVTVTAVNDDIDEASSHVGNITHAIDVATDDVTYGGLTGLDNVSVTVADNDAAGIVVSPTAGLVTTEAGFASNFTVVLSSKPSANVTIGISSSDPAEGTVSTASLVFTAANWYLAQSVVVTGVNDAVDDGDKTWTAITAAAVSTDGAYSGLDPANVLIVNVDNDTAGVVVTQSGGTTAVTEGGATDSFTVVLTAQPASGSVTVTLAPSSQVTLSTSTLTFTTGNWSSAQNVTVTAFNDNVAEGSHSTNIGFSASGPAYTGLSITPLTVSITDNDTAGTTISAAGVTTIETGATGNFTFRLNTQPTANVTVVLTSTDTTEGTVSPSSLTFTPGNFSTDQTVTVTGVDDSLDDGDIAYAIAFTLVSADPAYNNLAVTAKAASNTDNDSAGFSISAISNALAEDGTSGRFTVRLTSEPTATVSIGVTAGDATEAAVSVSSLSFDSSNWNEPQEVTVTGVDDSINDGDVVSAIVLSADGTTADLSYLNLNPNDVSVSTQDDDQAAVATSVPAITTTEQGTDVTFTVQLLSQPNGDVTIPISSSDTSEVTVAPASVTFNAGNWNSPQTVTVTPVDDFAVDGTVPYTILLGTITGSDTTGYIGLDPTDVSGSHEDNDAAAFVLSATSATTTEGATTANITVVLTSQPTANVTITLSGLDATEGSLSATTLTFTPTTGAVGGWDQLQTLTITGVNDALDDGDQGYTLTLTPTSGDTAYNALSTQNIAVTNSDNDAAAVTINQSGGNTIVAETGATDTYTIQLTSQPLVSATITVTPDSQVRVNGSATPIVLTFNPALSSGEPTAWNTIRTITVSAVVDTFDETNPHTANITHTVANYVDQASAAVTASPVSVTVNDNDPPQATVTSLTVGRGSSDTITSAMISATDDDTLAANLLFTVILAPGQGDLWLDYGQVGQDLLINGDTFTQAAITANRLSYHNSGTPNVSDGFAFRVSDAVGNQGDLTIFNITITGFIPPIITLNGAYSPSYTENAVPVAVDTAPSVSDPDSATYTLLTITQSGTGLSDDDEVFFATTGPITASSGTISYSGTQIATYTGGTGNTDLTVTFLAGLAGDTQLTDLFTALRYRNTSEDPVAGVRTVSLVLRDDTGTENVAVTKDISVLAINDPPVAANATVITPKNVAVTTTLTIFDVDNYPLTVELITPPGKGTLSGLLNSLDVPPIQATLNDDAQSRALTYTPSAGEEGIDSFTIQVTDPDGAVANATITVLIIGGAAARPWVISDAPVETEAGSPLSYDIEVDFSELPIPPTTSGEVTYTLVGTLPAGVTFGAFTPNGTNATLTLTVGGAATGVIEAGIVVTETASNTSGYQPITIVIVPPGTLGN